MIYAVRHLTTVDYAGKVRLARFNLRLKPAPWPGQILRSHSLSIFPVPGSTQTEFGPYLVNRSRLTLRDPISRLSIESRFTVEVQQPSFLNSMAFSPSVAEVRQDALLKHDLTASGPATYLFASPMAQPSVVIADWATRFFPPDAKVLDAGRALMNAIHDEFRYDAKATDTHTPPSEAFAKRRGVCQDFAHIMIIAARAHAIPAAYVSGYLRTLPPAGQPRLVGADATHAWVNLWCGDELGWVGFDPTNRCFAGTDHIFTAMGRDYADVAPLDGVFRGSGTQTMKVAVDVSPVA